MEDVFRLWGYSPSVYRRMVGEGCPIRVAACSTSAPVFGRVELGDELVDRCGPLASFCASGWWSWLLLHTNAEVVGEPLAWFRLLDGSVHPIVTRTVTNAYYFWFDVDRTIKFIQSECYLPHNPPRYVRYGVNPDKLPWCVRNLGFRVMHQLRRLRRTSAPRFPARPADVAVDGWRYLIRGIVEDGGPAEPVPFWPDGKRYAVVLSHDIDTDYCLRSPAVLDKVRAIEEGIGMRSAWMLVAKLFGIGRPALDDLYAAGHEIGFHGTVHDHRLAFLAPVEMARRIACAAELIDTYGAMGFRSPSYLRTPGLYQALDGILQYDMSMHDAVEGICRSAPRLEGCSTCLPFFVVGTDVLEIPTTVPEDWHFDLLGHTDPREVARKQLDSLTLIKARSGVASVLTHAEPAPATPRHWMETYREVLTHLANDEDAWVVTPGELNRHWRNRRARIDTCWRGKAIDSIVPSRRDSLGNLDHDALALHAACPDR